MKANKIINIILTCVYIPLSIFCFLCYMGITGIIDETNTVVILLTNIFCYIGLFMPVIALLSLLLGNHLHKNHHIKWSYFIRFMPVYLFVLMIVLDSLIMMMRC